MSNLTELLKEIKDMTEELETLRKGVCMYVNFITEDPYSGRYVISELCTLNEFENIINEKLRPYDVISELKKEVKDINDLKNLAENELLYVKHMSVSEFKKWKKANDM